MPDVSRRTLLRGMGAAGVASVGGVAGASTHATLADTETFLDAGATGGTLDLELATRSVVDGETTVQPPQSGAFPSSFASARTVTVDFGTIEPSGRASGTLTVAFRVCDNPGRVWLRATGPNSALADAIDVTVSYAGACGGAASELYAGSLSGFLSEAESGTRLDGGCLRLGRVEMNEDLLVGPNGSVDPNDLPGSLTFNGVDGPVVVDVTGGYFKDDGELRGVDLASSDASLCRVDVKGGGKQTGSRDGIETYRLDCASEATELLAGTNPGGQPSGLSHFDVYVCGDECVGCDPACLTVDWTLRNARSVAGESLSLDLELFARQCRHRDARNPW